MQLRLMNCAKKVCCCTQTIRVFRDEFNCLVHTYLTGLCVENRGSAWSKFNQSDLWKWKGIYIVSFSDGGGGLANARGKGNVEGICTVGVEIEHAA